MADPSVVDALNTLREAQATIERDWSQRGCHDPECPCSGGRVTDLLVRLNAALSVVETALADLGNALARERSKPEGSFDQWARLQEIEARAVAAEAERDAQKERADDLEVRMDQEIVAHGETEAERDTLRQALEQIVCDYVETVDPYQMFLAARAVLAGEEPT